MDTHRMTPLPATMEHLDRDSVGRPIPWFAHVDDDGHHDFRVADARKMAKIARGDLRCWVCGRPRAREATGLVGPMCTVTRSSAEPPGHYDCMVWSVQNCPFLINPNKDRRDANLPDDASMPGVAILRNPGVMAVWTTRDWTWFKPWDGSRGILWRLGDPTRVSWWKEGRAATRAEVLASIESGLPAIRARAVSRQIGEIGDMPVLLGPQRDLAELDRKVADLDRWLPDA